jgi:hypothetical protein
MVEAAAPLLASTSGEGAGIGGANEEPIAASPPPIGGMGNGGGGATGWGRGSGAGLMSGLEAKPPRPGVR